MENNLIIIDSGLDYKNDFFKKKILNGIEFKTDINTNEIYHVNDYLDENNHGSQCASIINSLCEDVKFYPIKVIGTNRCSSTKLLVEALKYCEDLDIRLICISLATVNHAYYDLLRDECNKLNEQGKIIVSSLHNRYKESAPAIFKSVIGIRGRNLENKYFKFNKNETIQGVFDNQPQLALGLNGQYSFFKGNSKANSLAAGVILNILKKYPKISLDELSDMLGELGSKKIILRHDTHSDMLDINKEDMELAITLKEIIDETLDKKVKFNDLESYPLMSDYIGFNYNNFYRLLINIEQELKISFDYEHIYAYDVCTLKQLCRYIKDSERRN